MDTHIRVNSITPSGVFTRNNATPPQMPFTAGCRFYAVDSLTFLDQPGEYYINRTSAELFYLPLRPLTPSDGVTVSRLESVIVSSDAKHISFINLTISDSRGDLVVVNNASNMRISGCTIKNTFGKCMAFDGGAPAYPLPQFSRNTAIVGNIVSGCGGEGMSVMSGNRSSLQPWNFSVIGEQSQPCQAPETYTDIYIYNYIDTVTCLEWSTPNNSRDVHLT